MFRLFLALFFLWLSVSASAKGISPYLPLNTSLEIEVQIEKVMALTDGAPLSKPYKVTDLKARLEQVKDRSPVLYKRVKAYLNRFTKPIGGTHLSAKVAIANDSEQVIANERNIQNDSKYEVSAGGFAFINPHLYASFGMTYAEKGGAIQTNSHIGFGYEYAQVELGYREHWFSPFQDSAMLVSTHAKSSPSITLSNATPITDWNLRYEIFYSRLEEVDGILFDGEYFSGKPHYAGFHASFTPLDFWTIGASRTLQFGGGKREVDFSDAIEAIFNPVGKDNRGDPNDPSFEFGNQQASITSKWNFDIGQMPISIYAEIAGEDTLDNSNFKLGNQAHSLGIYLPMITDDIAVRYEFSNWKTAWYVHHLYQQGYTNYGQIMGHWGGSEREFGVDTPAQTHNINLDWNLSNSRLFNLNFRTIANEENTPNHQYERGYELKLHYSSTIYTGFWGVELRTGKNVFGEKFHRLSTFYRW